MLLFRISFVTRVRIVITLVTPATNVTCICDEFDFTDLQSKYQNVILTDKNYHETQHTKRFYLVNCANIRFLKNCFQSLKIGTKWQFL